MIRRRAMFAPLLVLANALWYAVGWYRAWGAGVGSDYLRGLPAAAVILLEGGAVSGPELLRGEWWRLAAGAFVHVGVVHLLANMLMLSALGPVSERIWGRSRFAAIYLGSALAGAGAAMAIRPVANGTPAVVAGASGALWGVLLSVIVWFVRVRKRLPHEMAREWRWKLGSAALLNLLLNFVPGVSAESHAGGGFAGAALALWFDRSPRPNRSASALGALLAGAAVLIGLLAAMRYTPAWRVLREPPPSRDIVPSLPPEGGTERPGAARALAGLAPPRLGQLVEQLKRNYILGKHSLKSVEETKALRNDAESASESLQSIRGGFAGRCTSYAFLVRDFADETAAWLARPLRSPLDEVEAKFAAVLAAWAELNRKE